ncbi:Conserved hypothetical protein [Clostridium neonatale]|nr:Conserved hypothetical protein [Clostridium neonatale]CAI3203668.1 Conserved hypothetical protein [Clostridium neonatale]CAI3205171.1 Conserved hypothetical protein [Clostridium neonatale]CAI3231537.1 Conserved hypothetical protein [Clostridium neonatale]CAI3246906.1 Conserved hypothetical protein [Clostridium neonatale]
MKTINNSVMNTNSKKLNIFSKFLHSIPNLLMNDSDQEEVYHPYKDSCYFRDIYDIQCTTRNKTFH